MPGPHLARLAGLAQRRPDVPLLPSSATEVASATRTVLAEVEAAGRAAVAAAAGHQPAALAEFLATRLARLAAAADDATTAARSGDVSSLTRELHRFDSLTAALCAVQRAIAGPAGRSPAAPPVPGQTQPDDHVLVR